MDERIIPEGQQGYYDNFHFAPAVRVGDLLVCSGQIGRGPDGCPDDPTEQFRLAFESVKAVLEAAGGDLSNVVEMTTYHVGMNSHMREFMAVKDEYMSEPWCAWTAIGCTELAFPGALAEIRVQAHL